ncbi:expressed unknown protein [Seminavis robusta]|uniref:Uncharacterized protein n=1 Tax=Seminavis robusta TaxID=568900 RepID=A0A9N8DCG9_9STRA|nr:expressed unknown protein [Seminavis robusta]|eukprot:Sro56_g033020.1 n/a (528) ;mRNA; f:129165-130843
MTTSHGQTMIIDRCQSFHQIPRVASNGSNSDRTARMDSEDGSDGGEEQKPNYYNHSPLSVASRDSTAIHQQHGYGSMRFRSNMASPGQSSFVNNHYQNGHVITPEAIRFQVVVWDVGPVDVALGRVPMTFRVTMFWDDVDEETADNDICEMSSSEEEQHPKKKKTEWAMAGRRKAYERVICDETIQKTIDVPPISLLNVVTFDTVGDPEVCVLEEKKQVFQKLMDPSRQHSKTTRLMRWTCLYKATLMQHNMRLDRFPHDEHILTLKLGILVHRRPGCRWDMNQYGLELASEEDSMYSTRIPHGLIVDHAKVPDFRYNAKEGLDFQFVPLSMGGGTNSILGHQPNKAKVQQDHCLEVRLRVGRDSGYYDHNMMPLIGLLNVVAVVVPLTLEGTDFFQRGLMLLNITFVQIGIRMNVDKHLPSVGYQIKMQRIMNEFFFSLLFLVLESSAVYILMDRFGWTVESTEMIDMVVAAIAMTHIIVTWSKYYWDKIGLERSLNGTGPSVNMDLEGEKVTKKRKDGTLPVYRL